MPPVDRKDAPPGTRAYIYRGERGYGCGDCHFGADAEEDCPDRPYTSYRWCGSALRPDRQSVIFMTEEEHERAKSKP